MKSVKKVGTLFAVLAAMVMVFAGCAGKPKVLAEEEGIVKRTKLEDKGEASGGLIKQPEWIAFIADTKMLEKQKAYANDYVFVIEQQGGNLDAIKLWVQNAQIAQDIARMVATRVEGVASGDAELSEGLNGPIDQALENTIKTITSTTFTGARQQGDWWIKERVYDVDNRTKYNDIYYAYMLYTIDRKQMNNQIANEIKKIALADNSAMASFYDRLIQSILASDLGVEIADL